MEVYDLLNKLIKTNDINILVNEILNNKQIFLKLNSIKSYKFNFINFLNKKYDKSKSDSNLVLMFRLVEDNFYKLVKQKSYKNLKYKEEIKNDNSSNEYLIFLTNEKIYLNLFKCYLMIYFINITFNQKKMYLGIDFEFNTKVVALMQINFEQSRKDLFNYSLIFLFHPDQLDINWKKFFIKNILCRNNVYKILHGSDSLDIPYVYNNLLSSNTELIIKFNRYFIDTKYLCEYNFYRKNQDLGKCKIYKLLLNEDVISSKIYDKLLKNEEDMGFIYNINIDVNNLSEALINYTLYDVIFLPKLVTHFKTEINEFSLINQLVQLSFLDKKNLINISSKNEVNKINSYLIFIKNKKFKLFEIYNIIYNKFLKRYIVIENILKINYIKSTLILMLKYETYVYIAKKFIIKSKISNKSKYNNEILNIKFDYYNKGKVIKLIASFRDFLLKEL
jgi:hypothetical protein